MIVSHSRKFVFVHIQKTGGTSMTLALDPHLAWDDIVLGGTPRGQAINDTYRARFGLHKHSSIAEIETVCGRDLTERYFTFALVRRPVERICSLYNFVAFYVNRWSAANGVPVPEIAAYVAAHPDAVKTAPELNWVASRAFTATPDFSAYIRSDALTAEHGYAPQIERLRSIDGALRCRALRLEDQDAWLPELRTVLGLDFSFPHQNKAKQLVLSPAAIGAGDRRFLETRFAADYAAFRY